MISRRTICGVIGVLLPMLGIIQPASGQPANSPPPERLSLDAAISLAVAHNRGLASANRQVEKAAADLAVARTRRLPQFEASVSASQLLTPVEFSFPAGAFGEIPGVGPFPVTDTVVESPRVPTVFVSSQASQPLTQLFRINLGIQNAATARDIERERARG